MREWGRREEGTIFRVRVRSGVLLLFLQSLPRDPADSTVFALAQFY